MRRKAECGILLSGDIRLCLDAQRKQLFWKFQGSGRKSQAATPESLAAFGLRTRLKYVQASSTPVHPGNAKQVMEPATLWFERRARKVKRVTSGKLLIPWPRDQRAATIHRFCYASNLKCAFALYGESIRQSAFAVSACSAELSAAQP